MTNSPLRLEGYFFSHVEVKAHADGDPEADPQLRTVSELGKDEEDGRYLVTVRVDMSRAEGSANPSYTGLMEVRGFFRPLEGYPAERCDEMVYVNGSSILYGAAREMLLNLTARGPWPSVMLPSVRFTNDRPPAVPAEESEPGPVPPTPKGGSMPSRREEAETKAKARSASSRKQK